MKRKHTTLALIALATSLTLTPVTAMASEFVPEEEGLLAAAEEDGNSVLDTAQKGPQKTTEDCSLSLTFQHGDKAIDGAEITITYVMGINLDLGRYYPVGDLTAIYGEEVDFDDVPAIGLASMATEIAGNKAKPKENTKKTTGADGTVTFDKLEMGMYLIEETGKSGTASKYSTFEPFLITVPAVKEDGTYLYQVSCMPKTQAAAIPDSTSETPPTPTLGFEFNSLTGLSHLFAGAAMIFVALGFMAGLASALANRKRK